MAALMKGHRAVDASRNVRDMNVARVAWHASNAEASSWAARQGDGQLARRSDPSDLRAAQRAALEALGIKVEE